MNRKEQLDKYILTIINNGWLDGVLYKWRNAPSIKNKQDEFRSFIYLELLKIKRGFKSLKDFTQYTSTIIQNQLTGNSSEWYRKEFIQDKKYYKKNEFNENIKDDYDDVFTSEMERENYLKLIDEAIEYNIRRNPLLYKEFRYFEMYYKEGLTQVAIAKKEKRDKSNICWYIRSAEARIKQYINNKKQNIK